MGAISILGIDPGLQRTGFGIIHQDGGHLTYIASGVINTTRQAERALPARLSLIVHGMLEIIETYHPSQVAIEEVFVNVNPKSTLLLGQARGAAMSAAVLKKLPVAEYTALQVKQAVVGHGHAQKNQIQAMVQRLLNLPAMPSTDSADALACAICHAHASSRDIFRMKGGRRT